MTLPYPIDPALPSNPNPFFNDNSFVRGSQFRSNNAQIWADLTYLDGAIPAAIDAIKFRSVQGFALSLNISNPTRDIDIAPGICKTDDLVNWITNNSVITKRIDTNWAAGTNQGGFLNFSIPSASRASSGTTRTVVFQRKHGFLGTPGSAGFFITITGFANSAYNVTNTALATIVDDYTITYTGVGSLSESTTPDTSGVVVGGQLSNSGLSVVPIFWYAIRKPDGTQDYGFSRSAYEVALPSGYTKKRYLGLWFITGGASATLISYKGYENAGQQIIEGRTFQNIFSFSSFSTSGTANTQTNPTAFPSCGFSRYRACFVEGLINGTNAAAWAAIIGPTDSTLPNPGSTINTISGAAGGRDSSRFRMYLDVNTALDYFGDAAMGIKGSIASIALNSCIERLTIDRGIVT